MKNNIRTFNKNKSRGAVAVEMALLLIPLIILSMGIIEFGRAMYQYNALTKSVRDAVRLLSQHDKNEPNYQSIEAAAKCLAVYGVENCAGVEIAPGLSLSHVDISYSKPSGTAISLVSVAIKNFNYVPIINPIPFIGTTEFNFAGTEGIHATMRQQ